MKNLNNKIPKKTFVYSVLSLLITFIIIFLKEEVIDEPNMILVLLGFTFLLTPPFTLIGFCSVIINIYKSKEWKHSIVWLGIGNFILLMLGLWLWTILPMGLAH